MQFGPPSIGVPNKISQQLHSLQLDIAAAKRGRSLQAQSVQISQERSLLNRLNTNTRFQSDFLSSFSCRLGQEFSSSESIDNDHIAQILVPEKKPYPSTQSSALKNVIQHVKVHGSLINFDIGSPKANNQHTSTNLPISELKPESKIEYNQEMAQIDQVNLKSEQMNRLPRSHAHATNCETDSQDIRTKPAMYQWHSATDLGTNDYLVEMSAKHRLEILSSNHINNATITATQLKIEGLLSESKTGTVVVPPVENSKNLEDLNAGSATGSISIMKGFIDKQKPDQTEEMNSKKHPGKLRLSVGKKSCPELRPAKISTPTGLFCQDSSCSGSLEDTSLSLTNNETAMFSFQTGDRRSKAFSRMQSAEDQCLESFEYKPEPFGLGIPELARQTSVVDSLQRKPLYNRSVNKSKKPTFIEQTPGLTGVNALEKALREKSGALRTDYSKTSTGAQTATKSFEKKKSEMFKKPESQLHKENLQCESMIDRADDLQVLMDDAKSNQFGSPLLRGLPIKTIVNPNKLITDVKTKSGTVPGQYMGTNLTATTPDRHFGPGFQRLGVRDPTKDSTVSEKVVGSGSSQIQSGKGSEPKAVSEIQEKQKPGTSTTSAGDVGERPLAMNQRVTSSGDKDMRTSTASSLIMKAEENQLPPAVLILIVFGMAITEIVFATKNAIISKHCSSCNRSRVMFIGTAIALMAISLRLACT